MMGQESRLKLFVVVVGSCIVVGWLTLTNSTLDQLRDVHEGCFELTSPHAEDLPSADLPVGNISTGLKRGCYSLIDRVNPGGLFGVCYSIHMPLRPSEARIILTRQQEESRTTISTSSIRK